MTEQQKQAKDSIAGSMLSNVAEELGLEDLFHGEITHLSFDCPKNLREAFKEEVKRNSSSVCKELQKYQLSYIVASRIKKHAFGNTISKLVDVPVTIENLNFSQYVQSRVRRYGEAGKEEQGKCHFCSKSPVGEFVYIKTGEKFPLCKFHAAEFVNEKTWGVGKNE